MKKLHRCVDLCNFLSKEGDVSDRGNVVNLRKNIINLKFV